MPQNVTVQAAYDPEASVWYVQESNLPGLSGEADTFEALVERLPGLILDLLEENGVGDGETLVDVPIEVTAHRTTSTRHSAAA